MGNRMKSRLVNLLYKVAYWISPRLASDIMYYRAFRKKQNLEHPQNLIEKINWLQFNSDTSMWTICADKYRVRDYITNRGLGSHLPVLYGHWDNVDEINFLELPNEFVLKSNNGCGTVKIVRDKSKLDVTSTKRLLKKWLHPYGYIGGQSHYMRIKPCIIAEELLHEDFGVHASPLCSLVDYKVWCFMGKPECILVIHDRVGRDYLMEIYDTDWKRIPNSLKNNEHNGTGGTTTPKPRCLQKMLEMATILSEPFPEVRVDFYIINGKPIVGEMTFTSGYGNYTDSFYEYLGSKIDLQC